MSSNETALRSTEIRGTTAGEEDAQGAPVANDAYACLVAIYQDSSLDPKLRLDAAKAALPYERSPRKAMERVNQTNGLTDARRDELLAHIDETMQMIRDKKAALERREREVSAREAELSAAGRADGWQGS